MSNCCFTAFDAKLFLIPVFSFFSQLLIPLVNLVSQEDQIRPFKRRRRKKKLVSFPLWVATNMSHLFWPDSQLGNQMGTLLPALIKQTVM